MDNAVAEKLKGSIAAHATYLVSEIQGSVCLQSKRTEVVVAEFRQPLKLSQPDEQTDLGLTCSVCKGMSDYSYKRACSWL